MEMFVKEMTANEKANMEIRWVGQPFQISYMLRIGSARTGAQFAGLVNKMLLAASPFLE